MGLKIDGEEPDMKTYTITTERAIFERWQVEALSEKEAKRKFYEEQPLYLGKDPMLAEELVIIDCTRD